MNIVTVCPNLVRGPMLQSTTNARSMALVKLLKEKFEQLENKIRLVVDVRDIAESLLMVYEKPKAEGRYICTTYTVSTQDLVEMLKRFYSNHDYPKSFTAAAAGEKHIVQRNFRPWVGVSGHSKKLLLIPLKATNRLDFWTNLK